MDTTEVLTQEEIAALLQRRDVTMNKYLAGIELGKAYTRRAMAEQTTDPEAIRKNLEKAAAYERNAEELQRAA